MKMHKWTKRWLITMTVLYVIFVALVWVRLYPYGYNIADAQADREKICNMFEDVIRKHGWKDEIKCPLITGD